MPTGLESETTESFEQHSQNSTVRTAQSEQYCQKSSANLNNIAEFFMADVFIAGWTRSEGALCWNWI